MICVDRGVKLCQFGVLAPLETAQIWDGREALGWEGLISGDDDEDDDDGMRRVLIIIQCDVSKRDAVQRI